MKITQNQLKLLLLLVLLLLCNRSSAQLNYLTGSVEVDSCGQQTNFPIVPYDIGISPEYFAPPYGIGLIANDITFFNFYGTFQPEFGDMAYCSSINVSITFSLNTLCIYNVAYLQGKWGPDVPINGLSGMSGFLPAGTNTITAGVGGSAPMNFEVAFQAVQNVLAGHVYCTSNGSPVAGASVQIGIYSATSDTNGSYYIVNLPAATYIAMVSANNYVTLTNMVTIPSSVQVVTNNFALSPLQISVTGQVYCVCDGSPISGALVQIGNYSATSGSGGSYTISGMSSGTYSATVTANNYASLTNTVTIPSSAQTVTNNFTLSRLLPALDYFGVGVNWANVTSPSGMNNVRGDIDATNLYNHLQIDLSSVFKQGMIVPLQATASSANNLSTITAQFNTFINNVCPNDTVIFYASSHGIMGQFSNGTTGYDLWLSSDGASNPGLTYLGFSTLLNELPSSTRKIVIVDACHSGGLANYLANSVNNISILASSSAYPVTVAGVTYDATASSEDNGTGVFTDDLIAELDLGIFDLGQITYDILLDKNQIYASLEGQDLALRDSGSAVFTGLQPQLWEGLGFSGNLTNNVVSILQPPPTMSQLTITNGSFQTTLTNMPTNGAVAIEMSTNLISWLQVAFDQAAGTNVTFTFPTTNNNAAFFRTKVVP